MRKLLRLTLLMIVAVSASSCSVNTQLYDWGRNVNGANMYEYVSYNYYKTRTPESFCMMMATYQKLVSMTGGVRNVPPPGICAEFGYFLLQPESLETFQNYASDKEKMILSRTDFFAYGIEMMEKEMEYYPESRKFLERIVNRVKDDKED